MNKASKRNLLCLHFLLYASFPNPYSQTSIEYVPEFAVFVLLLCYPTIWSEVLILWFVLLFFVALMNFAYQNNTWDSKTNSDIFIHSILLFGSAYYFWAIGSSTAGLRKCLSNKDLREKQATPEEQLHQQHQQQHLNPSCFSASKSVLGVKKTE